MGVEIPAATSLESPEAKNQVEWKKEADKTGFVYSGKNSFKSGEGEFTVVGQGDSFSGSHSHLLLADVPGDKANSGASITAENAGGDAAFFSAETTVSQQAATVGAGSELRTVINEVGESDFVQRIDVNSSNGSAEFPGGTTTSNIVTVNHGLGVTPTGVDVITEASEAATVPITARVILASRNSTSFKVRLYGPVEISKTTINFIWTARR